LIIWYGDLTALQACRDDRDACIASAATTCNDDARECVRAVLEGAFDAMCEDRTAQCADAGSTDGACGRIIARCAAGLPGPRGDGDGGFTRGDGGWSGGQNGGRGDHRGHRGHNCDGGDDDEDPPTDEEPPTVEPDASLPTP